MSVVTALDDPLPPHLHNAPRIHAGSEVDARAAVDGGALRLVWGMRTACLHPCWLRDRSTELGQIEPTNRQRLFTPFDIPPDLQVMSGCVADGALAVEFSDGHRAHLDLGSVLRDLGWIPDPEAPPAPEPWEVPRSKPPETDWGGIGWTPTDADDATVLEFLDAFYRHGFVVIRNTPAEAGVVEQVANRIGYISGQNFGWTFDVRSTPNPTDLAYTSLGLLAHTDEPYRIEPPGIQLLHCIVNGAIGGDSTIVDGLAAAEAMRAATPLLFDALAEIEVEFRYDMGSDTVVNTGRVFELDRHDRFRSIRLNTKLDVALPRPGDDIGAWYVARRWLTAWLNDPRHQATFRLEPGDVLFMDNRRVLHGRTAFDPLTGHRHLQGCYIEHDGPDTMYRLTMRRRLARGIGSSIPEAG